MIEVGTGTFGSRVEGSTPSYPSLASVVYVCLVGEPFLERALMRAFEAWPVGLGLRVLRSKPCVGLFQIIKNGYNKVVVFEDDIRFEPYFRRRLGYIMEEVDYLRLDWDLM